MPTSAAIYCRISQDRSGAAEGVGRQEPDCRAWADQHGWAVGEVYIDDDLSASNGKPRPSYLRLLADVDRGERDGLVIWHPDRLHRSTLELENFIALVERTGIAIGTVKAGEYDLTTSTGRMTARIVGAVARHEVEHKADNLRRKLLDKAQNGRVPGGGRRPFGYEHDRITIRESEARLIREAADRILAGDSLRSIATGWEKSGVSTISGSPWSLTTVRRLLAGARIAGWRTHHGEWVAKAEWPAIITEEQSKQLRALLTDPARRTSPRAARSYLLTGFVRCGACGAKLGARPFGKRSDDTWTRRYLCAVDKGGCNHVGIAAGPLEDLVVEAVLLRLDTPALAAEIAGTPTSNAAPVEDEMVTLEVRLRELDDMWATGEIDRAARLRMRAGLQAQLDTVRRRAGKRVRDAAAEKLLALGGALRGKWADLSLDQRRTVIGAVVDRITIAPAGRSASRFDPERVDIEWADESR